MTSGILDYFRLQRRIFGVCPHSGELFRLSDCRVYLTTRPGRDWMDELESEDSRLDTSEARLAEKEEGLRERARMKGRKLAARVIKKIDTIFKPRRLNPDDAKVLFHPVDYVVFDGMKEASTIRKIVVLDHRSQSDHRRRLQRSIKRTIDRGHYEWLTLRIREDGSVDEE